MAMFLCNCGRVKSSQPYHSAQTHRWVCETCADRNNRYDRTPHANTHSTPPTPGGKTVDNFPAKGRSGRFGF